MRTYVKRSNDALTANDKYSLHGLTFKLPMEGSPSQLNFNFTRLSKALAGVLCLGYVVQLVVPTARDYLTLVLGRCVGSKLTRLVHDHTVP